MSRTTAQRPTEELYLAHRDLIERAARFACRRAGLDADEADDFVATVHVELIDDDYAVLRKHRGESKLSTYLTTVVHHLFQDFQIRKLGKYRPSSAAKRLGTQALQLERLLVRERHDLRTAIEFMRSRYASELSDDEIRDLAAQLPRRPQRPFLVSTDALESAEALALPEDEGGADGRLRDEETASTARQVEELLGRALASLPPQDLLILRMCFGDGMPIALIARALRLRQRSLYTRRDRSLRQLRGVLEEAGLTWDEVREILGWRGEIRLPLDGRGERSDVKRATGPSHSVRHDAPRTGRTEETS